MPLHEGFFLKKVGYFFGSYRDTHRRIGVGAPLGGGHNVGHHVPVLYREQRSGAVPAGHHLVADQQHAVFIADLPQSGQVFWGRNDSAVGADHRLNDNRRHVALFLNHIVHVLGTLYPAILVFQPEGTAVAISVRGKTNSFDGEPGPLRVPPSRVTGKRQPGDGSAVIGMVT